MEQVVGTEIQCRLVVLALCSDIHTPLIRGTKVPIPMQQVPNGDVTASLQQRLLMVAVQRIMWLVTSAVA